MVGGVYRCGTDARRWQKVGERRACTNVTYKGAGPTWIIYFAGEGGSVRISGRVCSFGRSSCGLLMSSTCNWECRALNSPIRQTRQVRGAYPDAVSAHSHSRTATQLARAVVRRFRSQPIVSARRALDVQIGHWPLRFLLLLILPEASTTSLSSRLILTVSMQRKIHPVKTILLQMSCRWTVCHYGLQL